VFAQKTIQHEKVVKAEAFELVDGDKKMRGLFGLKDGDPSLTFFDEDGKVRGLFSLLDGHPGLIFVDTNGKIRSELGLKDGGTPTFFLNGENGEKK